METENKNSNPNINNIWEKRIKEWGADFVYFVDTSLLPKDVVEGYSCVVLYGKALSKEYIRDMKDDQVPKHKEVNNVERKMDALAVKVSEQLEAEGYKSTAKLTSGVLPHKTVALRAGLGFIGKNNLLVTDQYGCALMMGKVLTTAPFTAKSQEPKEPQCGDCHICANVCPTHALHGRNWDVKTTRDEIINRKLCVLCLKCMVNCPYTVKYINEL